MPEKKKKSEKVKSEKVADKEPAKESTEEKEEENPVPGGFNEETFQLKATKGRPFPTNWLKRILFLDTTKRLLLLA